MVDPRGAINVMDRMIEEAFRLIEERKLKCTKETLQTLFDEAFLSFPGGFSSRADLSKEHTLVCQRMEARISAR